EPPDLVLRPYPLPDVPQHLLFKPVKMRCLIPVQRQFRVIEPVIPFHQAHTLFGCDGSRDPFLPQFEYFLRVWSFTHGSHFLYSSMKGRVPVVWVKIFLKGAYQRKVKRWDNPTRSFRSAADRCASTVFSAIPSSRAICFWE